MGRTVLNFPRLLCAYHSKEQQPWSRNVFMIDYCHDNQDPWHGNETSGLTFVYGIHIFMVDRRRNLPEPWQATSKLVENSAAPSC